MIDTLKASQELVKNGFSTKQAQSIVNVVASKNEQLATKEDIRVLHDKIDTVYDRIDTMQDAIHGRVDTLQDKMKTLQWTIGLSLTLNIAVLLALIFR